MEEIEEKVRQVLHQKLFLLEYGRRNPFITEWKEIRQVVESLIPTITGLVNEERDGIRKLQAKLNQLYFSNNPERDQRMLELYKQGLSRGQIAREVGMSKWGVSKALIRLGVNSVDRVERPG